METVRILIGNEPRAYREVLAAALQELRPTARVELVEPASLDAEVTVRRPALVVCSQLTPAIRRNALAWILLYPDGEGRGTFGAGELERDLPGVDFDALVEAIDLTLSLGAGLEDPHTGSPGTAA